MSFTKNNLSTEEKHQLFAQVVDSPEGRQIIAEAMVEPIRRALEYQAIGRKLLLVDPLPQGSNARYERDPAATAHVIARRGAAPQQIIEGEEFFVPLFEIAAYPSVRLSEIKARRFFIVDRAQIKAKEALQKEEDTNVFNTLIAAVNNRGDQIVTNVGPLALSSINTACMYVEEHDLVAAKIVVHARLYAQIRGFGKTIFDEASTREILTTGLYGHLYTADIHVSSRMAKDTLLVTASPDTVGVMPIRQDITVLPADDPKNLRLGWVVYLELGICCVNDYAVSAVVVVNAT